MTEQYEEKEQASILATLIFLLFLFSGQIRPIVGFVMPSLSLLLLIVPIGICALYFMYSLFFKRVSLSHQFLVLNGTLLFITCLLIISALYTPSEKHYLEKFGQWIILLFAFIFPQVVKLHKNAFVYGFSFASFVVFLIFLASAQFAEIFIFLDKEALRQLSTFYLTAANYLSAAFILVFFIKRNYILLAIFTILILMTGARGPLVFLVVSMFMWGVITGKIIVKIKTVIVLMALLFVFVLVGLYLELSVFDRMIKRFGVILDGSMGDSISARFHFLEQAVQGIELSPVFGSGIGSFGINTTGFDTKEYPHNILVEAWYDMGILGLLSFLFLFLVLNFYAISKRNWGLFVFTNYFLMNALKSSSFVDHRVMMAVIAFLLVVDRKKYFVR